MAALRKGCGAVSIYAVSKCNNIKKTHVEMAKSKGQSWNQCVWSRFVLCA